MASGTLPEGEGPHARGTGGSGNWPTGLPARTCSPRESCETGYAGGWRLDVRYSLCSVRRILRLLGFSSERSATMYASATDADSVRQWQAGATGTISGAKRRGFTIVV